MKITVIGTGYVGLVTGVCFALDKTNVVTCIDNNVNKINTLNSGKSPIYEPGLEEQMKICVKENRLFFTTEFKDAVNSADLVFIAVGTPPTNNGSTNMQHMFAVVDTLAREMEHDLYLVIKSTVPVGTAKETEDYFKEVRRAESLPPVNIFISSNPEFLKEGTALKDFLEPDRIVIGTDDLESKKRLAKLYSPFKNKTKILYMNVASAQLTKYAANTFNACKISFINSIADYCEEVGADIGDVADGLGTDKRIGRAFLNAGIGWGGSCFPKDTASLNYEMGGNNSLIKAVIDENTKANDWPVTKLRKIFANSKNPGTDNFYEFSNDHSIEIAILGLAFKPNTDDIRFSPGVKLIKGLSEFYTVRAYDPIANENAKREIGDNSNVTIVDNIMDAVTAADIIILCTEWDEFKKFENFFFRQKVKYFMRGNIFIDGRNMFADKQIVGSSFKYYCVGIPQI